MRIEHMVNTEDPTDVDMEREDLGQMTSTFLRVSLLKKWLSLSIYVQQVKIWEWIFTEVPQVDVETSFKNFTPHLI